MSHCLRALAVCRLHRDAEQFLAVVVDGNEDFADRDINVRHVPAEARRLAWVFDARTFDMHLEFPLASGSRRIGVDVSGLSPLKGSSKKPHPLAPVGGCVCKFRYGSFVVCNLFLLDLIQIFAEQIRLNSPDAIGEEDWRGNGARSQGDNGGRSQGDNGGTSRAENGIRLYTNFGSPPLTASIFSSTSSSIPLGYVSGETDAFIGFLHDCHERRTNSKDENFLFSPAIFDPGRSAGTNRGKANIAYLRHVVHDFENGELKPEELPNLFPGLRMVVTNSFNHSAAKPRFRAIFPTSEIMTSEVYGLIQGCLADKLEDAGYAVDRGGKGRKRVRLSNSRPSGLDWSKSLPTSLFYLPCQAHNPGESFFHDYAGGERRPLEPAIWLQNMTFPLQPGFEVADLSRSGVDEALVQRAKDIWRGSQPGRGDEMFFTLALSLRRAGMGLYEIKNTLRSEAELGRSPKERLSQIPSVMTSLRRYFGGVS
jgi:hypothetical protein